MSTILQREGKSYLVEDGKIVKAANDPTELLADSTKDDTPELQISSRVEADGKLGVIVSRMETYLGQTYGVRFDSGDVEAFFPENLKLSEVEAPTYDTVIDEVVADYKEYEEQEANGIEGIQSKMASARSLNLRAKALASDSKTALGDRVKLDEVVTSTGIDLNNLASDLESAQVEEYNAQDELPKYELSTGVYPTSSFTRDDVSWLDIAAEDAEEDARQTNWHTKIVEAAVELAAGLDPYIVDEDDIVDAQTEQGFAMLAGGLDLETREKLFPEYVEQVKVAVHNRRSELAKREASDKAEVADLEQDLDDDDPAFL